MSAADIERLAEVLALCDPQVTPIGVALPLYGSMTTHTQEGYRSRVRALLKALREPTEGQYEALSATGKMWRELTSAVVWKTYIDHLLNEEPTYV